MDKQLLEIKLDQLALEYEKLKDQAILDVIEKEFLKYLKEAPQDHDTWIRLAIFVNEAPHVDFVQAIKYLEYVLAEDNQNLKALLVLADIKDMSCGGIDKDLLDRLSAVNTEDNEKLSMIEYIKSKFYRFSDRKKMVEHLARSVNLYSKHVNNNEELGEYYFTQGKIEESCKLIKQALKSVAYVFPQSYTFIGSYLLITTVDDFIAEFIKGTYTSCERVERLGHLYLKYCSRK